MSLVGLLKGRGTNGFGHGSTAEEVTRDVDLRGCTILVTGCGSGLGRETLRVLCLRGARVFATARTLEAATAACDTVPGEAIPVACDLSEPASIRAAVETVRRTGHALDAIIANAGIMAIARLEQKYGLELQFLTNHVGHHMLVTGVVGQLAPTGRVVVLSSSLHTSAPADGVELDNLSGNEGYHPWRAYGQSKLANLLFAKHLAARLPKVGQRANAVHPGVIRTGLVRHLGSGLRVLYAALGPLALKSVEQGAATQCYVAVHPAAAAHNGAYFVDCNVAETSPLGRDATLAAKLWEKTESIIAGLP
jgi:WW domain-containing oxidoreductase